eukprot:scaffold2876_cov123-Isochrysis_galbana.AAC.2
MQVWHTNSLPGHSPCATRSTQCVINPGHDRPARRTPRPPTHPAGVATQVVRTASATSTRLRFTAAGRPPDRCALSPSPPHRRTERRAATIPLRIEAPFVAGRCSQHRGAVHSRIEAQFTGGRCPQHRGVPAEQLQQLLVVDAAFTAGRYSQHRGVPAEQLQQLLVVDAAFTAGRYSQHRGVPAEQLQQLLVVNQLPVT